MARKALNYTLLIIFFMPLILSIDFGDYVVSFFTDWLVIFEGKTIIEVSGDKAIILYTIVFFFIFVVILFIWVMLNAAHRRLGTQIKKLIIIKKLAKVENKNVKKEIISELDSTSGEVVTSLVIKDICDVDLKAGEGIEEV